MQISAQGEDAIRAVLDLALQRERGLTPTQELAARPDAIPVGGVLRAVEGRSAPFSAQRRGGRDGGGGDLVELWEEVSQAVSGVVDRLTFGELAARARERRSTARPMYHISPRGHGSPR